MTQIEEKEVRITDPERILRIFRKICSGSLQVFIRPSNKTSILIKAKAVALELNEKQNQVKVEGLFLTGISERAYKELRINQTVEVDFMMLTSRLVFNARILRLKSGQLLIDIPKELKNIERRKSIRIQTTETVRAYLCFKDLANRFSPITPVFAHYKDFEYAIPIFDISLGGACLSTPVPFLSRLFKIGYQSHQAVLVFPMQKPVQTTIKIVWSQPVQTNISETGGAHVRTVYRFGCNFIDPGDDVKSGVAKLIQTIVKDQAL